MSGAQSWSVKGIDPKVREAAREAAARQGMTLGEYLSLALQNHQPGQAPAPSAQQPMRLRAPRVTPHPYDEEDDDWLVSSSSHRPEPGTGGARITDPVRLAQRIDSIERRTQLAVTGLDRAVSTIDRSVLGLAARIEDAESVSRESADRIAEAIEQFRSAGDTLSGRLESAEREVSESREALDSAKIELSAARERLEAQVSTAEEVARKAEAAAAFLTTEMANREAALGHRLSALEDEARDNVSNALAEARAAAEAAAQQASEAFGDALNELREVHARLAERVDQAQINTRQIIEGAIEHVRSEQESFINDARAQQNTLAERLSQAENDTRTLRESVVEEVVRLESEIGTRIAAAEALKSDQSALLSRLEKIEAGGREATAGLRQAAGAAIADLRNAQLGLAARLKQVEEAAGRAGALDLADLRTAQAEIAARLATLEARPVASPVDDALAAFERRLEEIAGRVDSSVSHEKIEEVGGAVKTLDQSLQRLAERIAESESTANSAIRTLEETVSSLSARVDNGASAAQETEAVRALVEQRLEQVTQTVTEMVDQAKQEFAGQVSAALHGGESEGLEGALADVNRRLAAAERRQAQTIEAISIEIKRMSETVDRRLRSVEAARGAGDEGAGVAVREELARMSKTLEARFDEIERREAAAFDRMGLEVGRLSERLEERVGAVESRSAQAIEQVGEQVARMAERFNQRHEILARDLGERMLDSEERSGARVAEAINSMMQRLGEVEERSVEAVAPVQKAVSSIASRLEGLESDKDDDGDIPTPSRRDDDFPPTTPFSSSYVSPMQAAQPLRAGPLPPSGYAPAPAPQEHHEEESDIYFADEDDLLVESGPQAEPAPPPFTPPSDRAAVQAVHDDLLDDPFLEDADAFAPPPPEDEDPFWTPDAAEAAVITEPQTPVAPPPTAQALVLEPEEAPVADEPPPPPGKNDYLNAARKAAQAQAIPAKPAKKGRKEKQQDGSLRGSSRIVLWTAASAITMLVAGGVWYLNEQNKADDRAPEPSEPQPDLTTPTQALTPPAETYDPAAPFGEPVDPPPSGGPEGVTQEPATASPEGAPIAEAAPQTQRTAAVAAGPLPPRNVSLEQAAQNGDLVAQYELGLQRISAGRTADGVALLRRSADRGMAMAQYRLAKLYERGEGVPADLNLARQWTERAAAAGNRRAMHDLGVYFARGEGAPLDEAAAFRWFRQAAELGVADSQYNLGVLYQQGRGVNASASEAMFWFLVAARQGDEDAASRAQTLEAQLAPIQVEQARARAQAFRPRAASAPANGEFGPRPWNSAAQRPAA